MLLQHTYFHCLLQHLTPGFIVYSNIWFHQHLASLLTLRLFMATYKNMADFQKKLSLRCIRSRTDFLQSVKWASLQSTDPYPDNSSLKGILLAMHSKLLSEEYTCETCGGAFHLRLRLGADRQSWDWISRSRACDDCAGTSRSLTSGTVLEGVKTKNFLNFFDCLCMWSFDYPSWIIVREAGVWHQQLKRLKDELAQLKRSLSL